MQSLGVFLILNQAGEIVYVRDGSRLVMGYERQTIMGYGSRELIGKKASGLLFTRLHYEHFVTERNLNLSTIVPVKYKDGTVVLMHMTAVNWRDVGEGKGVLINLSPV